MQNNEIIFCIWALKPTSEALKREEWNFLHCQAHSQSLFSEIQVNINGRIFMLPLENTYRRYLELVGWWKFSAITLYYEDSSPWQLKKWVQKSRSGCTGRNLPQHLCTMHQRMLEWQNDPEALCFFLKGRIVNIWSFMDHIVSYHNYSALYWICNE